MKRLILLVIVIVVLPVSLFASRFGLSLGVFDAQHRSPLFDTGTHVQAGFVAGLSSRWEGEAFVIASATPEPFTQVLGGLGFSYSIMGPVYHKRDQVPTYATAYVSGGFMADFDSLSSYGPFVRITPLSVGGSQFRLRERTLSLGAYYNIPEQSVTLFWNLFHLDFFLF